MYVYVYVRGDTAVCACEARRGMGLLGRPAACVLTHARVPHTRAHTHVLLTRIVHIHTQAADADAREGDLLSRVEKLSSAIAQYKVRRVLLSGWSSPPHGGVSCVYVYMRACVLYTCVSIC